MTDRSIEVLTVGHSTLPYEEFLKLLRKVEVNAIADVRTAPYSRHFPHFNRNQLREELRLDDVAYVFLGKELGGRPSDRTLYCDGVADYEKMAVTAEFDEGLRRVIEGAKKFRIALMCSEQNPLDCHRCLLVGRVLAERGVHVSHILGDAKIIVHSEIEEKLLKLSGRSTDDFFAPYSERLESAYRKRARKVAFAETLPDSKDSVAVE